MEGGVGRLERGRVVEVVEELTAPVASAMGLELVDAEFVREGGRQILRLVVDRPDGGVTLDDCHAFSQAAGRELDAADPIPQSYYLEVMSPGLDRPLKRERDYARSLGKRVQVKTFAALELGDAAPRKVFVGELRGLAEGRVALVDEDTGGEISIPGEQVARARLHPDWDPPAAKKNRRGRGEFRK